ncbi:hypothetical protein, partial [Streptococcus pneumoniae]|uniref:hypothetical protein n=1 Tax=Streptococcus pneumoniae TaxID=1313 RepID=UPI001E3220CA
DVTVFAHVTYQAMNGARSRLVLMDLGKPNVQQILNSKNDTNAPVDIVPLLALGLGNSARAYFLSSVSAACTPMDAELVAHT